MNRIPFLQLFVLQLFFSFSTSLFSQTVPNTSALTIEAIMQGEAFVGYLPEAVRWSADSKQIYFTWNPDQELLRATYQADPLTKELKKLSLEELRELPDRGDYSKDGSRMVYEKNGDLFLMEFPASKVLQLTNTLSEERSPLFVQNDQKIAYRHGRDLFTLDLQTGAVQQLTQILEGHAPVEMSKRADQDWLQNDQLTHFEVLRQRKALEAARAERNKALEPKRPPKFYLQGWSVNALELSPDLNFAFLQTADFSEGNQTDVPNFVTESGFTENLPSRPKVGSPGTAYEQWIFDLQRDTFYQLDLSDLPGVFEKPAFLLDYAEDVTSFEANYEEARSIIAHGPYFSSDGQAVLELKALDNKDRWIVAINWQTGRVRSLDRQHDDAWIGGPGITGWNGVSGNMGWLPDNQRIWFHSEETGFSHLYLLEVSSGRKKALTNGKFEVLDAQLSKDGQYFYLTTNQESPHQQHFYRLAIKNEQLQKLTGKAGGYEVTLSPDEQWLAIRYSSSNQPWELYVMPNQPGAAMQQLTHSTSELFKQYDWRLPEIVYFEANDGAKVPARLYRSADAKPGGPAVIFVHGAGYLQNVHEWWSSYYREYMFHNLLVDNGYTVLDIDYRASSGYGRNWRTAIYRHMGGRDLDDQIDGARFLTEKYGVDPDRIGIYGGSYGGFITLMALFKYPGVFQSGAALRSVTDWAHYNHPYTSNILNTPVEDSMAYYRSSPIYHAQGLEDQLLMLHGMIDQNVQFQDVVRLSQRLIELGKDNWELAVFPVERHGFIEPASWADEYKRIFKLFQTTLKKGD